jgi:phage/plasmid-associated DNA primase
MAPIENYFGRGDVMISAVVQVGPDVLGSIHYHRSSLIQWEQSWHYLTDKGKDKRNVPINLRSEIADHLITYNQFLSTSRLYIWNGIKWDIDVQNTLYKWIEQIYCLLKVKFSQKEAKEIEELLIKRYNERDPLILNSRTDYIPFQNGYYHIATKTLQPPRPDLYFTYNFEYDIDATQDCPHFKQFMTMFMKNEIDREDIYRYCAYCMTNTLDLQKALILHGSGSNGKTVFFEILAILWKGLYCKIPIQKLDDQFVRVNMRDILLNIVADLPSKRLEDEGAVKECITDISLEDDEKYFPRARWRNTTKHIYGCNKIPLPPFSPTEGFYRRWIIKQCLAKFKDKNDKDFDPNLHFPIRKITDLLSEIVQEIPAIFAFLITYLPTIDKLYDTNILAIRAEWNKHSENVLCFLNDECDLDPDHNERISLFYATYCKWCKAKGLVTMTMKGVSMAVQDQGVSSDLKQVTLEDGKTDRVKHYFGVKIKDSCPYVITKEEIQQEEQTNILDALNKQTELKKRQNKAILNAIERFDGEFNVEDVNVSSQLGDLELVHTIMNAMEKAGTITKINENDYIYSAKSVGKFKEFTDF